MIVPIETPMQKSTERKEKMTTEKTLSLVRMSDVQLQEVKWLWKPYIPFGKLTIIQGDPGEGKTTFALRLAAACSSGVALPGMEIAEPFNVIYQTSEDGLGDTIKPRLIEAGADESRVLNICEDTDPLSLSDERIEQAIRQTNAKLMILDPIQGYIGERIDTLTAPTKSALFLKRLPPLPSVQAVPLLWSVTLAQAAPTVDLAQ